MAAALVSSVLEQLATIIYREVEQEVRLVVGVDNEVQKLTRTFKSIQRVLVDAETRQLKEDDAKLWLDELRDISYEMDDVLDDWSTAINKSKLDHQQVGEDEERGRPKHSSKVSCFSGYFRLNKFGLRHDIAHRIKCLNERLEAVANENERRLKFAVSDHKKSNEQVIERSMTSSFIDKTEVKGRDRDKNIIVEMLVGENSPTSKPQIVSIVGMGGLGKTTLAQLVFNDENIKRYFDKRIWLCVSDPFDEFKIANEILQSLPGNASKYGALQPVMEEVEKGLRGKRFLLVLDDVWNEDQEKWKKLKDGLVNWGIKGSRILVTTRKENVAGIMGCTRSAIFQPGVLSREECWLVFSEIAFADRTTAESQQFEGMGRKIADKCDGLPLAAKALGGLLRFRKSRAQWESVLESKVWELKHDAIVTNLFAPLWLSYYDLRPELKQCFAFCAVFPKDYKMKKDELIKLWMSQGYLKGTENEDMEMVGEEYFQNLAHRSFFQDFNERDSSSLDLNHSGWGGLSCKMHDIVHDFSQFVARNECVSMEVNDDHPINNDSMALTNRLRHLFVQLTWKSVTLSFSSFKRLRSLYINRWGYDCEYEAALPCMFKELTCLRCLSLKNCEIMEIPSAIGSLKHLRFLDLSSNSFMELPEATCELYNLQTLILWSCSRLVKLPVGMGKLINLRHLSISASIITFNSVMESNICLPKGIGRLSSLRTLNFFNVWHGSDAFCLADLKRLNKLSGSLWIKNLGENAADVAEAKEALLQDKKNLSHLQLEFCGKYMADRELGDQALIEALEPPRNLEELRILDYQGSKIFQVGCGCWMPKLKNLKAIELHNFRNCEFLPPLGNLQFLEHLVIWGMDMVKKVGIEFLGLQQKSRSSEGGVAFPSLIRLEFGYMPNLEEWDFETNNRNTDDSTNLIVVMPGITHLKIWGCPVLKELPEQLFQRTTPERLDIFRCNLLEKRYR